MKVIVTGGNGFLGSSVVRAVRRAGHHVTPLSRRSGVDLRDGAAAADALQRLRPDLVIHCAAHVGGIAYVGERPTEIFEDNLRIGLGLVQGLEAAGIRRLLNILPNCTYPGHLTTYEEHAWWAGPLHPSVLDYGLSRKVLWGLADAHSRRWGLEAAHVILPNLYGPGDHFDPARSHALGALVAKIVHAQRTGQRNVSVWGTGRPVREWMFVEDAAEGILRVLERFDRVVALPDHLLNLGGGPAVSIADLADAIRLAVGWTGDLEYDPSRPDGAAEKRMSTDRMTETLAWSPRTSLAEGIRRTVEHYGALTAAASRPQE